MNNTQILKEYIIKNGKAQYNPHLDITTYYCDVFGVEFNFDDDREGFYANIYTSTGPEIWQFETESFYDGHELNSLVSSAVKLLKSLV